MKVILVLFVAFLGCTSGVLQAVCTVRGTSLDPQITGSITFVQNATNPGYTDVIVSITGITTNLNLDHGMHIHAFGDISKNDGTSTLGHFLATGEAHACPPNVTRHMGDMGNFFVDGTGTISITKTLDKIELTGPNSIIGHAVILHSGTDDCVTAPTGNSGSRIAQCVVGIANVADNTASNGLTKNANGAVDTALCVLKPVPGSGSTMTGYGLMRQAAGDAYPSITIVINNADGNAHGIHIHEFGDLSTGAAAGSHWNPANASHGMPGFRRHLGDLGNAYYYVNGDNSTLYYRFDSNDALTVYGPNGPLGRTLVVHQNRDDCSNPIGGSGGRMSSCVWGIAYSGNFTSSTDLTYLNITLPTVPTTLDAPSLQACQTVYSIAPTSTPATSTPSPTKDNSFGTILTASIAVILFALLF